MLPHEPVAPVSAEVSAELVAAVSVVHRVLRRAVRQSRKAEPLRPVESELLRLVELLPGLTVADAARRLRLAPNTVSSLVGRLSAEGLIDRRHCGTDGRLVMLTATSEARRRLGESRDLRAEQVSRALCALDPHDRRALAAGLPALRRLAEEVARMEEELSARQFQSCRKPR
jgi:DNA-binding MarR family transcriptional regulator